jgi:hypothetical protein
VREFRSTLTLLFLLFLVACGGETCPERPAPTPLDRTTTGAIVGTVTFQGNPPEATPVPLDASCRGLHSGPVTAATSS